MRRLIFVVLMLALVVGVTGSLAGQQELAKEQILRIAFDIADFATFDAHFATSTSNYPVVDMVFDALVRWTPGNQISIEPEIAESWEVSEDGRVWTFHLRRGVFFHPFPGYPDGYELTSEDVVYSFNKAADKKRSAFATLYEGMSFEAVDPYTVKITLEKPVSSTLFLAKVADNLGGYIMSKRALEQLGDEWAKTHPVGTGPFIFESLTPMNKVVLRRNDRYFRGAPILERVEVLAMPDVSAREAGLRTGEIDIIEGLKEEAWINKVATYPEVKIIPFGPAAVGHLHFNMTKPPFNILKVRQAVAYAISRDEIAALIGPTMAVPVYSPVLAAPAIGALTREEATAAGVAYETNLDRAKRLLAMAGYPDGFSTEVIISEMATDYLKPMQAIQAQLRKVGIDMKLKVVDHPTFHSMIRQDLSPLVYYECWRSDADVFLTRFFHSNSVVVTGKKPDTNFSHYGAVDADGDGKIDSIDDLIEEARWELNPDRQIELWKEAQIRLLENMAVLPIIRLRYVFPMKSYVDLGIPLEWIWTVYYPQITEKARILAH
jgi:peptide/nickel transport system substrate-binding protein